jgi:BirA family biotin operon repressor/biotin-[acetyl-CoA-carboxylase] ligase
VVAPGRPWSRLEVVPETGSTNVDVVRFAEAGTAEGLVLIAEKQKAGRGRLDRTWQAPARSGLTMSVLLRPAVTMGRLGWLPLLAGVAVAEACGRIPGVHAALKWPNDLLVRSTGDAPGQSSAETDGWGKCGGILAETVPSAAAAAAPPGVVLGIGINVSQAADELPAPRDPLAYPPTSLALALAGAPPDRQALTVAVLDALGDWYGRWLLAAGDPVECGLWMAYRASCLTLQREVTVSLPGGATVAGRASDIDLDGRLVVAAPEGSHTLAAGDVAHVR